MAGRFKETKKVGHQSSGGGRGRPSNLVATTTGSSFSAARVREEERQQRMAQDEELDISFGFSREVTSTRTAYLFNIRQSSLKVLDGSSADSTVEESCLDMYFVEEDGSTFKASHLFQPYLLIHVKGNSTIYGEVEQFLLNKYAAQIVKCEQYQREDLDMPNHLSGLQRVFMKISFRNVDDLVTVRRDLLPLVEKNRRIHRQNEEAGLDSGMGVGGGAGGRGLAFESDGHGGGGGGGASSGRGGGGGPRKKRDECMSAVVDIREYDVQYVTRVAIDADIRCGCWYDVVPEAGRRHSALVRRADIKDAAPLKKMAFDIETTKPPLKFPSADQDNVMMISYMIDGAGYLIVNRAIVSEDIADFEYTPKPEYEGVFTVFNVADERALLERWLEHIEEEKPLLYITYNGDFFDWPFLAKRCQVHGLDLRARIGIWEQGGEYMGRFAVHMDAFCWVKRDSYLPQGSQGLKAVTKNKLKYEPVELDPELMLPFARDRPQDLAAYSVSDAVATYYLYTTYVHMFVFSLSSIIPLPASDVLRKGSGTLCEALLMVEAFRKRIVCPNKEKADPLSFHKGHLLESETYIGGHVECLESGVFRSNLPAKFKLVPRRLQMLLDNLDRTLEFAIVVEGKLRMEDVDPASLAATRAAIAAQLEALRDNPNVEVLPRIYHLDVGAMYPNIILTNRLQPMAIVDASTCAACDFNRPGMRCQKWMKWSWRGRYYPASQAEYQTIVAQMDAETFKHDSDSLALRYAQSISSFSELPQDLQAKRITARVKSYSSKAYKGFAKEDVEERDACICQRENPFYVDTVRDFRDRRYVYKALGKDAQKKFKEAKSEVEKVKASDEVLLYESLQLAHKCILNSFYGYVMRRGARWHSIEMAGVVTQTGANIIKDARILVEEIGRPLELDTDGIWCFPEKDTRILTSRGFLFLDQVEQALAEAEAGAEPLLYASYDAKTRSMQYLPAELVVRDGTPPERLVDFTQAATRPLWDDAAAPATATTEANHVSIRVTPLHDMYAQLGKEGAAAPFAKVKAEELTSGRAKHSSILFLHAAQAGSDAPGLRVTDTDAASPVCALELSSPDAIDAFIELYGYWLGEGSMAYSSNTDGGSDGVLFSAGKDEAYLRGLFARVDLVEGRDWRACEPHALPDGNTRNNLLVVKASWFAYFDAEYWLTFQTGRERHGGLGRSLAERLPALEAALQAEEASFTTTAPPSASSSACSSGCASPASSRSSSPEPTAPESAAEPHFSRSELQAISALRRRGISPPSTSESAQWFSSWVLKCLSAHQMRLLLEGLRQATEEDSDAAGSRAVHTSSECMRDALVVACLHAGFTACAEPVAKTSEKHAVTWRVEFCSRATRTLDVADVRYEQHGDSVSSPPYSVAADGRLWCVRLPASSDQLLVAQRARRDAHGSVYLASRPMVLGNCMIPSTFPESFNIALKPGLKTAEGKALTSLEVSYPCSMLNIGVHDNYTNDRYQTRQPDGTFAISKECGIFFEVDGPYGAMILPASKDEGKNIKKRYAVFSEKGQLKELKGFEIKRRGELKLIKVFQEEVFAKFLDGKSLVECYESVGSCANHWLDVCQNGGEDLEDQDVFDLISENKNMVEALADYGDRKSTSIQTARRLGEFLGDEMVKDKGLNCKFIITKKPLGAPTSERAVPVAIFSAEPAVMKSFLRKWLKDPSLADFDVKKLLDWDYYIGRLKSAIQKIITIPAAFQKVRNPVPRVEHPDWLRKKLKERDDTHKQTRVSSYFTSSSGGPAGNDMEDIIGGSQARVGAGNMFTDPLRPKFAMVKRRAPSGAVPSSGLGLLPAVAPAAAETDGSADAVSSNGTPKRTKVRPSAGGSGMVAGTGLLPAVGEDVSGSNSDSGSGDSPSAAAGGRRRRKVVALEGDASAADDDDDDGGASDGGHDVAPLLDELGLEERSSLVDKALDLSVLSPEQLSSPSKPRSKKAAERGSATASPASKSALAGRFDAPSDVARASAAAEVEPSETDDFPAWIRFHTAKWARLRAARRAERAAEARLQGGTSARGAGAGGAADTVKLGRDGLTGFLKKNALAIRASYWQVVQLAEDELVPGLFRVWVLLDSGALRQMRVHVPRVLYVNSRRDLPDSGKKVVRTLPRGRPCLNLYELSMSEGEWVSHEKEFTSSLSARLEIEGVYETQVPLLFKLIMEIGCVCKLDAKNAKESAAEYSLPQLQYKTTAECPYLASPSQQLKRLYLFHSHSDARGVFGLFNEDKREIVVIAVNPYSGELEKFNMKTMLRSCVEAARAAGAPAPLVGEEDGTDAPPVSSNGASVATPSAHATFKTHVVKDFDAGFQMLNGLLRAYKDSTGAPTIVLAQTGGHSVASLYALMPVLRTDFPVVSVTAHMGDNVYPALNWYSAAVKRMTERYVAHPQWWAEQLHFCRYAHVPIGNIESDYPSFISDLFFARALKHSGHLLWMSNGPRPDLGGLEEDENYFADEHINPESSKAGVYRKVCMEIDIGQLAVNAVVQQSLIEEMEGHVGLAITSGGSSSGAAAGGEMDALALRSLQEGSGACRDAFRVLKNCVGNWLSDTLHNQNEDADMLLRHFYRWLRSPSSKLYDGALHRFIHQLMKKILAQLLARFRKLGSTVVFANQSKLILATNKSSIPHALAYTKHILDTVQARPLFQMLTLEPARMWECLAFLDSANYGGILADGQDEEDEDGEGVAAKAGDDKIAITLRSGRTLRLAVHSHWNLADYLPRETQDAFLITIAKFLLQPYKLRVEQQEAAVAALAQRREEQAGFSASQHLATLGVSAEQEDELLNKEVAAYIGGDFSRELFEHVARIKAQLRGNDRAGPDAAAIQFPVLAGSYLPLHQPALEFVKSVCHVLSLDSSLSSCTRVLRESLMKLVNVKSFAPEADFVNPCLTFVLPDVICSYCNQCRDLDLCRDPELTFHHWRCTVCAQPYDLGVIEWMLVEFITRRAVAFQVQDLQCATCGKIKQTNMAKYCPCSGHFVNTTSPQAFDRLMRTFSNIAVYHNFSWLLESISFIRERQPEITEFDSPIEENQNAAAAIDKEAGVGMSVDAGIEILDD